MKKLFSVILLTVLCISASAQAPKYVFYIIGDGMGINHVLLTQTYNAAVKGENGLDKLSFTEFPYQGYISTYAENSLVTDSAAAGTALATGHKTNVHKIGTDAEGRDLESITKKAAAAGYGTAIISTEGINHATPAAFYACAQERGMYNEIFGQLLDDGAVDFAAGGAILCSDTNGRTPSVNEQIGLARSKGWTVITGEDIKTAETPKSKTLLVSHPGQYEMTYAIDNDGIDLTDLTEAAIRNMEKYHGDAFFMMIEAGSIDHLAHSNDAKGLIHEINEMDETVKAVLDFYSRHPEETLVIVTADHETGGLGIGVGGYDFHPARLECQKISKNALSENLNALRGMKQPTWEKAKEIISEGTGLYKDISVSKEDEQAMEAVFRKTFLEGDSSKDTDLYYQNEILAKAAVDCVNKAGGVHFAHSSHTGAQVPLYVTGCGAGEIAKCRDNTDITRTLARLISGK